MDKGIGAPGHLGGVGSSRRVHVQSVTQSTLRVCFIHVVYMFVDCEDFPFSGGWVDSSCFHNRKLGCASATVAVNNPHAVPPQEM